MSWTNLFYLLLAFLLVWFCFRIIRLSPGSFSLENINKTLFTLGVMALILLGFIALLVIMLRHG